MHNEKEVAARRTVVMAQQVFVSNVEIVVGIGVAYLLYSA
jgi:hypothetical protein